MIFQKKKAVLASILSAAMTASAMIPAVSAASTPATAGTRTKDEAYGESTYAERFLSFYDDVITHGVENGYLSENNPVSGGFNVPYHSVEELCVEAPDYGHETTSEAMSYIVWMAAMKDNITKNGNVDGAEYTNDLDKAWKTLEMMIPSVQEGFMTNTNPSATVSDEFETPEQYPQDMMTGNTGLNPIHKDFCQAYSGDSGIYLMHWLADVDNWYGYGTGKTFTFINTFQRGEQESCWETIPHPSVEMLEYGMKGTRGIKGVFSTETNVAKQWAYTNAPDAEDRAIQAVYAANRWGVGNTDLSTKAGKMGDYCRNNMFDKYYKAIGTTDKWSQSAGYQGAHYLMSWYTSWGGAIDGSWTWQIGASHCHEFYQNPLAAYALLDKGENGFSKYMKASGATTDYEKSLQRQLEFYLWLQSADGPIAGGATSSWNGRYEEMKYSTTDAGTTSLYGDISTAEHFNNEAPTKFYKMGYLEHPVYHDPGSNHWIGNQVWAVQRLAELYYYVKTDESLAVNVTAGGLTIEAALKQILDKWVGWWFTPNQSDNGLCPVELDVNAKGEKEEGSFSIAATLDWQGQPDDWTGAPTGNSKLHCTVRNRGSADFGCVSSLANTLIYYAAAEGVDSKAASTVPTSSTKLSEKALYTAKELLDREWKLGRDDIGLTLPDSNGSMYKLFDQDVWVPTNYNGTMPNGDAIKNGIKFIDIRTKYLTEGDKEGKVKEYKAIYDSLPANATNAEKEEAMKAVELKFHRFWHAGDILLALGTMNELYPDVKPDDKEGPNPSESSDESTDTSIDKNKLKCGDVNTDGTVDLQDLVALAKYFADSNAYGISAEGLLNADSNHDGSVTNPDAVNLLKYVSEKITAEQFCPTHYGK